jgi:hypothetical protein
MHVNVAHICECDSHTTYRKEILKRRHHLEGVLDTDEGIILKTIKVNHGVKTYRTEMNNSFE